MSVPIKCRAIHLASRPTGWPQPENFTLSEIELAEPGEGEVLVRNTHMSVEPYMRGRMNDTESYVPPFQVGKPLEGGAVGIVVASRDPSLPEGTWVHSNYLGWREYAVAPAKAFRAIDTSIVAPSAYLGVLGVPGFTAWFGLHVIGKIKSNDVVFISSAAGAVGSIAGQLAKLAGATVIGSAGSPDKVAYLKELGFDAAFDYHGGDVAEKLASAAPQGIDLYFENVGGEQLEAALATLRNYGRIVACGMISGYNESQPGPRNMALVVTKRLTMQGFIISDHISRYGEFASDIAPQLASGKLVLPESFFEGIENAPAAFMELLRGGAHVGKVVVRLAPEEGA